MLGEFFSLTLYWMCKSSVCFLCSSRSAFGFSQFFLFLCPCGRGCSSYACFWHTYACRSSKYRCPSCVVFLRPRAASPLALLAVVLWLFSLSSGVASSSATLWQFTAPRFVSGTFNAITRSAPLRDRWFAVGCWAPRRRSLPQRGPLFVRSGFSLSGLGILPRRDPLGPPTHSVVLDPCVSSAKSLFGPRRLLRCVVWCAPLRTAISCDRASCSDASLFSCKIYFSCTRASPSVFLFDLALCLVVSGHASTQTCAH